MDSVDGHLAGVLSVVRPLKARELPLDEADGAVLTSDVTAAWPLPPFDNSAMDGYAVRSADLAGATAGSPVTLPVTDEVPAGDTRRIELTGRACIRIMTGALLPAGADAVVPVEWTDGGTREVTVHRAVTPGESIRLAGDDARPGDLLLAAGIRLGAPQLGLLAAAGHAAVLARPRPRLTVITTGNELAQPGEPLVPGRIWESNSVMLAAAARQAGCLARRHPVVRDDTGALLAAVRAAAEDADVLVTTGGVSMGGEYDVVKAALQALGTVTFGKVAMQPGMPQGFGTVGPQATPIFTLPGNPVSAYVSFCLFVGPALAALQGLDPRRGAAPGRAVLDADVRSPAGKRSFLRGVWDRAAGRVAPVTGQASHQLAALALANALIVVPEQVTSVASGETVDVLGLP
jgi:molybdopterin molybdotransferase